MYLKHLVYWLKRLSNELLTVPEAPMRLEWILLAISIQPSVSRIWSETKGLNQGQRLSRYLPKAKKCLDNLRSFFCLAIHS